MYRTNLNDLAVKHGTDKGVNQNGRGHDYCIYYEELFKPFRTREFNLLEIGVETGASLRLWQEYFPKAIIHGIDINSKCMMCETDRIKVHIGNQSDLDFLQREFGHPQINFEIIIDDGSKRSPDQITSLLYLFQNRLKPGGLYILEDLCHSFYHQNKFVRSVIWRYMCELMWGTYSDIETMFIARQLCVLKKRIYGEREILCKLSLNL